MWNDGIIDEDQNNLAPGVYILTFSDVHGCTASSLFTVIQSPALTLSFTKKDITCFGLTDGSATAKALGGVGTKTYLWNTGATTATISNLTAGAYSVTATDTKGCTIAGSAPIFEPAQVQIVSLSSVQTALGKHKVTSSAQAERLR